MPRWEARRVAIRSRSKACVWAVVDAEVASYPSGSTGIVDGREVIATDVENEEEALVSSLESSRAQPQGRRPYLVPST